MLTIREALPEDIPLLSGLIRDSFRDVAERFSLTPENAPSHPSNCRPDWILDAFNKGVRYFLLVDRGTPCGCVALERAGRDLFYLERLAVLPDFRGRGYGEALVGHALAEARRLDARRVEIGIIARHDALRTWYGRLGFVLKDTVHFHHLPFDVTFMSFELQT